jgi:O-antigen ligase
VIPISEKIIEFGLIFLILFTPLAFGSVYVWAFSIMEGTIFSLLIVLVIKKGIQGDKISFPLSFPIIAFCALILLQMTPLHPSALKFLSPKTYELYSQTLDGYPGEMREDGRRRQILEGRGPIGGRLEVGDKALEKEGTEGVFENWRTLSVYPHATRTEWLKIMSYLGVFLLIVNYVNSKRRLARISTIIVFGGIVVSLLGIAQRVAEASKIYWFWDPVFKKDASFFGPFVNPNHFAGYIEMVIPLSLGLFIVKWRHLRRERQGGIREFLLNVGTEEGCRLILFSFLIVLMVGALFLSSSRAGMISFLGSMVCLLSMLVKGERKGRNVLIVVGLFMCISSFLMWMGIRPLLEEFGSVRDISKDYDIQYRFQNWRDAGKLVRDFPMFGTGLETFSSIFPKYKTSDLQYYYLHLENDYLQLLCEMGILGFGIFLWLVLRFFRQIASGYSPYDPRELSSVHYLSLYGCLTGLVAIMIHSFWDFNMHIPSNALLLSMFMGLAIAGARISRRRHLATSRLEPHER